MGETAQPIESPDPIVIRATRNVTIGVIALTLPGIGACAFAATAPEVLPWVRTTAVTLGVLGVFIAYRWARSKVEIAQDSVTVSGIFRCRRFRLADLQAAELVTAGAFGWRTPRLVLKTGRHVAVGFVCDSFLQTRRAEGGKATTLVQALHDRLRL